MYVTSHLRYVFLIRDDSFIKFLHENLINGVIYWSTTLELDTAVRGEANINSQNLITPITNEPIVLTI